MTQQQYQSGYPQQQVQDPSLLVKQQQQQAQPVQDIRFYKSSILLFASAPGKLERDVRKMTAQGWKLKTAQFVGVNFWLQRVIMAIYER